MICTSTTILSREHICTYFEVYVEYLDHIYTYHNYRVEIVLRNGSISVKNIKIQLVKNLLN